MSDDPPSRSAPEDEFVGLLTGIQGNLHAFLTSLLPGERCIDDVLQQTNLVLWQKRAVFQRGTNFKAWAFSVARWETKAWLTRQKRADWLCFSDEIVDLIAGRFEQAGAENRSDNATLDSLRQCLGKLKEKDRLLVISHYQHGKSLAECSRIFERGADSLKVTLFRIRQILRRCIDAQQSLDRARS
jgi:RNA polymerase sigma-70 factor (ECF subfamily)